MVTLTTPLPAAPSRDTGADTFNDDAFAFTAALIIFQLQQNTQAGEMNTLATSVAGYAAAAVNAPGSSGTSSTSLAIGTGSKSLTIQTGKNFVPGQFVTIARTSDPAASWMVGSVISYSTSSGALVVSVTLTNGTGTFTDWTVSLSAPVNFVEATIAQIFAGTSSAVALTPASIFAAAAAVPLTDATTIAVDMATGINFSVTLAGNRTLGTPTNVKPGQSGVIAATQDTTGSRSLAFASAWKFAGGATPLSTAAGAIDGIAYYALTSSILLCSVIKDFKS